MKEKERVCWYCHKPTMGPAADLGKDWLRCASCGASEELNPSTPKGQSKMATWFDADGQRHFHPIDFPKS